MNFSDFMTTCGITERLDFYPYTKSCFDNLTDDEKALLKLKATNVSSTNIHFSNFNFLDEASPNLIILWALKAITELGGRIHEDDIEYVEDDYFVTVIFEGVEDGIFYVDVKKEDGGVRYKVWGNYSASKQQQITDLYRTKMKSDPSKIIEWLMVSSGNIEEQQGVISCEDFGYDSDDILVGLRKSIASFKKFEEHKIQSKGLI